LQKDLTGLRHINAGRHGQTKLAYALKRSNGHAHELWKSNLSTLLLAIFLLGVTASILIALMPPKF
jgi:hypothetical protein